MFVLTLFCLIATNYFLGAIPAILTSFFSTAFFCKVKKELPLVAFFYQQKKVVLSKSFSLLSGLKLK